MDKGDTFPPIRSTSRGLLVEAEELKIGRGAIPWS
jgi:hypothetical protein